MNYSKILALSMLLVSPFALAKVRLNTSMEMNYTMQHMAVSAELDLNQGDLGLVYDGDDLRIQAIVLQEGENDALIRYMVYAKHDGNIAEMIAQPELCVNYGQEGFLSIGEEHEDGQADSFKITLEANKI